MNQRRLPWLHGPLPRQYAGVLNSQLVTRYTSPTPSRQQQTPPPTYEESQAIALEQRAAAAENNQSVRVLDITGVSDDDDSPPTSPMLRLTPRAERLLLARSQQSFVDLSTPDPASDASIETIEPSQATTVSTVPYIPLANRLPGQVVLPSIISALFNPFQTSMALRVLRQDTLEESVYRRAVIPYKLRYTMKQLYRTANWTVQQVAQ